jgi:uncharacterized protein YbbC (DUF1343 family)
MRNLKSLFLVTMLLLAYPSLLAANSLKDSPTGNVTRKKGIITGADQTDKYLSYLKGKRVAMVANQTSIIGKKLSVDSLLSLV